MDLQAWREQRRVGEAFEMPDGLVIRLRRVSLFDLAEQGEIPAPLVGAVEGLLQRGDYQLSVKDFAEYAGVVNLLVKAAVVDPPVRDEADEEHLGVQELPMMGRIAIFNWANASVRVLRPFRPESEGVEDAS